MSTPACPSSLQPALVKRLVGYQQHLHAFAPSHAQPDATIYPSSHRHITEAHNVAAMPPSQGYDDEELSISLAPSNNRRTQNKPADASSGHPRHPNEEPHHPPAQAQKPEIRIGQYEIKRTLGEGSFGKVKLAVHRVTGQQVALKIIARRKLISRDMAGRVEREIEYLQLLRHPHIIKL